VLTCFRVIDLCAVKRDNVIFAVTHHGGHLGYFEGGVLLPNSVTWLDRIVVEFGNALLCQQKHQTCANSYSCVNHEPSAKKLLSENNDDDDDDDDSDDIIEMQDVPRSASPPTASSEANMENKLATEMVSEILRVSASVVYNGTGPVQPQGAEALVDSNGVIMMKSADINHSMM